MILSPRTTFYWSKNPGVFVLKIDYFSLRGTKFYVPQMIVYDMKCLRSAMIVDGLGILASSASQPCWRMPAFGLD